MENERGMIKLILSMNKDNKSTTMQHPKKTQHFPLRFGISVKTAYEEERL